MNIVCKHNLPLAQAREKLNNFFSDLQKQYSSYISEPHINWTSDTMMDFNFDLQGKTIKGQVKLTDREVIVDGQMPAGMRIPEFMIITMVRTKLEEELSSH